MRTTLDIPAELLAELKAVVPAQSRTEAVRLALAEFVRWRKREKLRQLRGRLQIQDVSREMEEAELADARHGPAGRHRIGQRAATRRYTSQYRPFQAKLRRK